MSEGEGTGARRFDGGCLCGHVRYATNGKPLSVSICHCQSCRKAAGAQSVAWATFELGEFEVDRESLTIYRSSPNVERGHCATCGTSISYRVTGEDTIDITVASMNDPAELVPTEEIWLSHRTAWEAVGDKRVLFEEES